MLAFRQPRNSGGPQERPLRSLAVCHLAVADSCGVVRLLGEIINDDGVMSRVQKGYKEVSAAGPTLHLLTDRTHSSSCAGNDDLCNSACWFCPSLVESNECC